MITLLSTSASRRVGLSLCLLVVGSTTGALEAAASPIAGERVAVPAGKKILGVTKESGGAVTVELTPERLRDGRFEVDIRVNTHTVDDLDKYDLKKITTLKVEGKSIGPTSAPNLKGHHNRGTLVFPLESLPSAFSIEIRGLDKPKLRVFSWP